MPVDTELVRRLVDGSLRDEGAVMQLVRRYQSAVSQLGKLSRQLDSVASQIELLERFVKARSIGPKDAAADATLARVLHRLAEKLRDSLDPSVTGDSSTERPPLAVTTQETLKRNRKKT